MLTAISERQERVVACTRVSACARKEALSTKGPLEFLAVERLHGETSELQKLIYQKITGLSTKNTSRAVYLCNAVRRRRPNSEGKGRAPLVKVHPTHKNRKEVAMGRPKRGKHDTRNPRSHVRHGHDGKRQVTHPLCEINPDLAQLKKGPKASRPTI